MNNKEKNHHDLKQVMVLFLWKILEHITLPWYYGKIILIMEEGRMICSFQKDWTDLEMKFLRL